MPIIHFTDADLLKAKVLEKGVYPMIISEIEGPKASKSGKSVNFFVTFRITNGPTMGKELQVLFGTEVNNNSVMGNMQMVPHVEFRKIQAAITGLPLDTIGNDIDTDALINKPFDGSVDVVTSEGNLVNTIIGYFPSGKGAAATALPF
jgi:hypothetical protein